MSEQNEVVESPQQEETSFTSPESATESQASSDVAADAGNSDEMAALKAELQEQKEKYLRLFAEFDNFKKRNAKERLELLKTAGQDIIRELLPVLDDMHRANKVFEQDNNTETYVSGIRLILDKLQKTLQHKGLRPIESIGKDFDVSQHEAIAEVPAPSEDLKGKIIDEVQSGYTLNDTIIRYAKVVVGK